MAPRVMRSVDALRPLLLLLVVSPLMAQQGQAPSFPEIAGRAEALIEAGRHADATALIEHLLKNGRFILAEPPLRRWVAARTGSARPRYLLGFALLEQFRSMDAEPWLREACERSPGKVLWMMAYAKALNLNRKSRAALEVLDAAYAIEKRPDVFLASGMCHHDMGHAAKAEGFYRRFLETAPRHAEAHLKLGQVLTQQGRYAPALAPLRKTLELEPDQVEARFLLGLAESHAGDKTAAVKAYETVLARVPHHVGALYNIGRLLVKMGRRKEGRVYLSRFKAASLLEDKLGFYREMVRIEPTNVRKRLDLSGYQLKAGLAQKALENLQKAQGLEPGNSRVYRAMARALKRLGRHTDAGRADDFATTLEKRGR